MAIGRVLLSDNFYCYWIINTLILNEVCLYTYIQGGLRSAHSSWLCDAHSGWLCGTMGGAAHDSNGSIGKLRVQCCSAYSSLESTGHRVDFEAVTGTNHKKNTSKHKNAMEMILGFMTSLLWIHSAGPGVHSFWPAFDLLWFWLCLSGHVQSVGQLASVGFSIEHRPDQMGGIYIPIFRLRYLPCCFVSVNVAKYTRV